MSNLLQKHEVQLIRAYDIEVIQNSKHVENELIASPTNSYFRNIFKMMYQFQFCSNLKNILPLSRVYNTLAR